jgi:hypothetical protein
MMDVLLTLWRVLIPPHYEAPAGIDPGYWERACRAFRARKDFSHTFIA